MIVFNNVFLSTEWIKKEKKRQKKVVLICKVIKMQYIKAM